MVKTKGFVSFMSLLLAGAMILTELGPTLPVSAAENTNDDSIKYISEKAYLSLDEDAKQAYIDMCEEIDTLQESGITLEKVVFATDRDGTLYESYVIPYSVVTETGSEYTDSLISEDISSNEPDVSENDIPDEEEETLPEETPAQEEQEADEHEYISENMNLIDIEAEEEETDSEEEVLGEEDSKDSLIDYIGTDYLTRNLSSLEQAVYTQAYNGLKGRKSSFSFTVPYGTDDDLVSIAIAKAVSIFSTTYLSKANKINFTAGIKVTTTYAKGKYTYNVSLKKSPYYTDSLQSKAAKKINSVVKEAYSYASIHYPGESFTYGIVEYLDNWLAENVAENPNGLSTDPTVMAGKEYFYCHTIYGPLLYGYGVCEGYAKALSQMLDASGITNIYVVSATHAYVYVLMNDDGWYIVDPMLNDAGSSSSKDYLLTGVLTDAAHTATGAIFKVNELGSYTLDYPDVSPNSYIATPEELSLNKQVFAVATGKSTTLSVSNSYYNAYKKTWSSENTKVGSISSSGKFSAKGTGKTTVSCTIAGRSASCSAYVYQITNIAFDNGRTSAKKIYVNQGDYELNYKGIPTFEGTDSISLTVNQKNKQASAYEIYLYDQSLSYPRVTSSDNSVATVEDVVLIGDTITVTLSPKKIGTTTISVKFGGKTSKLTYTVKQEMKDEWFTEPSVSEYTYNGTARKPKVYRNSEQQIYPIPSNLSTTTKYLNNKNAGTAFVSISGKGYYAGTISKSFTIKPIVLNAENTKLSVTSKMTYTGSSLNPRVNVTYGKNTKLKNNRDYTVSYVLGSQRPDSPTESGNYTVVITGTGNYTGSLPTQTLVVEKLDSAKLKLSASNVAWNNNNVVTPKITLSYNNVVIPRETSIVSKKNYEVYYYKKTNEGTFRNERLTSISSRGTYKVVVVFTINNIDNSSVKQLEKEITVY